MTNLNSLYVHVYELENAECMGKSTKHKLPSQLKKLVVI